MFSLLLKDLISDFYLYFFVKNVIFIDNILKKQECISYKSNFIIKMIFCQQFWQFQKRRLEKKKNSFEIFPGSGIEIRGYPLAPTYRYILYWLSSKLTSKMANWNYAKLAPGQVLSKTVCQPLQVPHTLCCFFLSSIWVKWAYKKWQAGIILNYKKILDVNLYTQKNRASVCKTLCPQHLLAPKYGQLNTVPYFHKKIGLYRKVKQVIYSSSPFHIATSNLADKVETPFAKAHNSRKISQHLFKC